MVSYISGGYTGRGSSGSSPRPSGGSSNNNNSKPSTTTNNRTNTSGSSGSYSGATVRPSGGSSNNNNSNSGSRSTGGSSNNNNSNSGSRPSTTGTGGGYNGGGSSGSSSRPSGGSNNNNNSNSGSRPSTTGTGGGYTGGGSSGSSSRPSGGSNNNNNSNSGSRSNGGSNNNNNSNGGSRLIGKPAGLNISDEQWAKLPDSQKETIANSYSKGVNYYPNGSNNNKPNGGSSNSGSTTTPKYKNSQSGGSTVNVNTTPTSQGYNGKPSGGSNGTNTTPTNQGYNGKPSGGSNVINTTPTNQGYNGKPSGGSNGTNATSTNQGYNGKPSGGSNGTNTTPTNQGYNGKPSGGSNVINTTPTNQGYNGKPSGGLSNALSTPTVGVYKGTMLNDVDRFIGSTDSMLVTDEVDSFNKSNSAIGSVDYTGLEINSNYENYDYNKLNNDDYVLFEDDFCSYVLGPGGKEEGIIINENNLYIDNTDPKNPVYKRYNPETRELSDISIYDSENVASQQYGTRQDVWYENFDKLINDDFIWDDLQKHYPVELFESEDKAMDFYKAYLEGNSCGYAAVNNVIFQNYEGREEEFEKTFGFPMYNVDNDGNIDFNYEYMQLLFYDYSTPKVIKEAYGEDLSITDFKPCGINSEYQASYLKDFLSEYGVDISANVSSGMQSKLDPNSYYNYMWLGENLDDPSNEALNLQLKSYFDKSNGLTFCGGGFDLYDMDGNLVIPNCGGHAMTVTGFTDDGKPIVSSWGEKFVMVVDGEYKEKDQIDSIIYATFNF